LRIPSERLSEIFGFIEYRVLPRFSRFAAIEIKATPPMGIEKVRTVYGE
jgi:hypothetical protein